MRYRRGLREAGLALLVAGAVMALPRVGGDALDIRDLETASLDLRFRLRGPIAPGPETAVILVDDRSVAALGRWPFSRRLLAQAVRVLHQAKARTVAFDLLLTEAERTTAPEVRDAARDAAALLGQDGRGTDAMRAALARIATDDPDGALAAALRESGRVLLPYAFDMQGAAAAGPEILAPSAYIRLGTSPIAPVFPLNPVAVEMPLETFAAAAAGLAHVNIAFDRDGAPRYDYLAIPFEADFYPPMAVRAVAAYTGVPWDRVELSLGQGVSIGAVAAPTDRAMRLLINYRGPRGTFPTFSFVDLIEGRVPAEAVRDRLILVGAAAVGINDTFRSPFGSAPLPGVERMANTIDTLLRRDFIQRPDWLDALEAAAVLLLAALAGGGAAILPTRWSVAAGLAPILLWAAAAQIAFANGAWLALVAPEAAFGAALVAILTFRYLVVDRDGRQIKSAFRQYLAPDLVNALAAHPERLRLGGETRPMTVMFCDVRNFTSMSEGMAPETLVQVMNRFLTPTTDAVLRHRGTVDKYIGDCLMAFWNAPLDDPDHASHACAAAREMLAQVDALGAELERTMGVPRLAVGVGLNSGPCLVGNLGSTQRFNYSVMGDTVNVASRLESLTKTYRVPILAGDATRLLAPGLPWLVLDEVAVKGRSAPVRVHTLWLGDPGRHARLAELHELILAARLAGRGEEVAALVETAMAESGPEFEATYRALARRRESGAQH